MYTLIAETALSHIIISGIKGIGYTKINLIWENCPKDEELDDFAEEYIKKWKETHT